MIPKFLVAGIAGVASTLVFGSAGSAHHGVTGRYDGASPLLISGSVEAATFAPPHPVLTVRVDGAGRVDAQTGRPEEYFGAVIVPEAMVGNSHEIELSPVSMFYRLSEVLEPGDRITLVALRNCLPPHQLRSTWVRLESGEVRSYEGDWAPVVETC
ncbi:MAG: hypothetical protein GYB53_20625 [Rhodobacteraceae bacterium]|nr:hypothetical protein [Paracoccaceae bacterium]MBR9821006.1 hypothetical protein [Paracoccaceae bacterium]